MATQMLSPINPNANSAIIRTLARQRALREVKTPWPPDRFARFLAGLAHSKRK